MHMRINNVFDMSCNKFVGFHFELDRDGCIAPTSGMETGELDSSAKARP